MKRLIAIISVLFLVGGSPASAEDFGLKNPQLAEKYRQELQTIANPPSKLGKPKSISGPPGENESDFDLLRRAYRAEPDATLKIIKELLEAGGKPQ